MIAAMAGIKKTSGVPEVFNADPGGVYRLVIKTLQ